MASRDGCAQNGLPGAYPVRRVRTAGAARGRGRPTGPAPAGAEGLLVPAAAVPVRGGRPRAAHGPDGRGRYDGMRRPEHQSATSTDAVAATGGPPEAGAARVDGVEVRYGDSPGRLRAVLSFRVGVADETLARKGITHLVEHLALAGCPLRREDYNGCVTDVTTSFMVSGDPEEVRTFLRTTTRALAALPLDRLDTERSILRTEDQGRGPSMAAIATGYRFGARRHGLVDAGDVGLPALTADEVGAWARKHFVRGNATLWLSAPPPEGLDLSALPPGDHVAPPPVTPLEVPVPAWGPGLRGAVGVSMLGTRTVALATGMRVLEQRLHRRLRQTEGRSYQVGTAYERWNAEDCELLVYADAQAEDTDAVREALAEELHRIADSGATAAEIAEELRHRARGFDDGDAAAREAMWQADERLLTGSDPDRPGLEEEYARLTPAAVAWAMGLAAKTAIWVVPEGHGVQDRRVLPLPDPTARPAQGRRFKRVRGVLKAYAGDELRVGHDEVGVATGDGWLRAVRFSEVAALQVWDDGARTVWSNSGALLFLHPAGWRSGAEAMAAIDAGVDPRLVVRTGEDSGFDPSGEMRPRRRLLSPRA